VTDEILRDLRLPEKFQTLRRGQAKAIREYKEHKGNYLMQIAPTGMGKSLIYVCGGLLRRGKTVVLTSTKALQDQLVRDFGTAGMVEVRGRANYICELTQTPASYGPCRWGHHCYLKVAGCPYYDAVARAKDSDLVVTNYAFWLCSDALGHVDNLVLDEAHASFDHLISHYTVQINLDLLEYYTERRYGANICKLRNSQVALAALERRLKQESKQLMKEGGDIKQLGPLSSLCENVRSLRSLLKAGHDYVTERRESVLHVHPITAPSELLFKDAGSVLLTSATVNEGTAELLGIPGIQLDTVEYDSSFPVRNRPVYVMPGVRMDRKTPDIGYMDWAKQIDQIIRQRPYKGIIHTVSYARQQRFMELSRTGPHLAPKTRQVASAIGEFKRSREPVVLVSPSVTTGYDFPDEECRFQVIAKVPFPDTRSKVQQKRSELFPSYPFYYAWQQIVQAAGRGVRSEDDWCETYIVDSHFNWLRGRHKHLAQKWFLRAIQNRTTIPTRRK